MTLRKKLIKLAWQKPKFRKGLLSLLTKEACVIATKEFEGSRYLIKIRDRNYRPRAQVVHMIREKVEVLYYDDQITGWVEGLNEHGVGVVNSALAVKQDETIAQKGKRSRDRPIILKALEQNTLGNAKDILVEYRSGVYGHTIVSNA